MNTFNYSFDEVIRHFEKKDKKMATLLRDKGEMAFFLDDNYFESLVRAIISQQISTRAARTIYEKVERGVGGRLLPEILYPLSDDVLISFGLSPQKRKYLRDLAEHFIHDAEKFDHIHRLDDREVLDLLTKIKGVGMWTSQMFLIFSLGRPDVFAPADLGLRNAMMRLYNWKTIPDRIKIEKAAEKWRPYRTVACHYLWHSIDP